MPHDITLKSMTFHASVGVLPHERIAAQPLEVDLRVRVADREAHGGEAHAGVVDYRGLYDLVARVVMAGHIDYLEEIADRIASGALAHSARVRHVAVAVRKPHVALGGPLAYAEVAVERSAT